MTRRSQKEKIIKPYNTILTYYYTETWVQRNVIKIENINKRKYTMFNIMTDRWLQRRQRSPWRSTKTMGEKKRPQPGTNHGQMLLVCGVREWRQTGLAPQHTARTRTHAPGNNTTRRTARQARARGNAQYRRVAIAVLPQPTITDWNRTDGGGDDDDSRDWRATDGRQTDRPTKYDY